MTNISGENRPEKPGMPTFNGVARPKEHISSILGWISGVMTGNYHRGQQEHGWNRWNKRGALGYIEDEIRELIDADSLSYLSLEGMLSCLSDPAKTYFTACWTGEYRVEISPEDQQQQQLFPIRAEELE